MRKIVIPLIAGALAIGLASPALADSPRADTYWVVSCGGTLYEAVDVHAVSPGNLELGGKSLAVFLFSQNTGLECELIPAGS